jgi:hypothetical protein
MENNVVELSNTKESDLSASIPRRPSGCVVPLTESQLDHWRRIGTEFGWRVPRLRAGAVRILGPLDVGVLVTSIEAIVQRHESLRTRIVGANESPLRQYVAPTHAFHLEQIDLSSLSSTQVEDEARRLAQQFLDRPIDIRVDPLFKPLLLRLSPSEHVLLLTLDHLIGDGVSCGILRKEILTALGDTAARRPISLPKLAVHFPDYAVWLEETYDARRAKDGPFWDTRTIRAPNIRLPAVASVEGSAVPASHAIVSLPFGKALSDALRDTAQREQTLLPIAVLTVYLTTMAHWCKEADWPVLFAYHGRSRRAELQSMIGFLSTALHLRIEVSPTDKLVDLLHRVHAEYISAGDHQDYIPPLPSHISYAQVFNWGRPSTEPARRSREPQRAAVCEFGIRPFPVSMQSHHDFYPKFTDTLAGVITILYYRRDLFPQSSIERLGQNMRVVAESLTQRPTVPIGSLSLT